MTKKKKIALLLTSIALVATLLVGGTLAYFTDTDSRENVITLGKVSGILTETDEEGRDDGTTGKDYENVKPGDTLAKDPTVTLDSDSERAYARIRIHYGDLTDEQIAELEAGITWNTGWSKSGDYFYYKEILDPGDSTTIFETVKIPSNWGNPMAEKTFNMDVVAELIQADNFTPDMANGVITGWGTVDIEAAGE